MFANTNEELSSEVLIDNKYSNDKSKIKKRNENTYDNKAKIILSDKQVIVHILKHCVKEYKDTSLQEIYKLIDDNEGRYITGINIEDNNQKGSSIKYDILFTPKLPDSEEEIGLYINLEAQGIHISDEQFIKRAIEYGSRLITRQVNETIKDDKDRYKRLKKIYTIWIYTNPSKEKEGVFNLYFFNEECLAKNYHIKCDIDFINIILIGVSKNYDENETTILKLLNLLFTHENLSNRDVSNKLNNDYNVKYSESEVSYMFSLAEGLSEQSRLDGIKQGIKQGVKQGKVETILNMLDSGLTKEDAFKIAKADEDIKQMVIKELNHFK